MRNEKKITENLVEYKDGQVIFEAGSDDKDVYFILEGKVEVSHYVAGMNQIVAILEKGEFFGEMAAVSGDDRSMTITAMGDLSLHKLSLDEMLAHMQQEPKTLKNVFTNLVMRLRDTNSMLREITLQALSNSREENWTADLDDLKRFSILVVDDHPNIVKALKELLSDEYNVFTALDGQSALGIMKTHEIALVLADYRMPGMTGVELLKNVKEMSPDTIRIMVSKHVDHEVLMKAIRTVQAHEVIPKPWRDEEIKFVLARWIEQYRKTRWLKEKANQHTIVKKRLEEANELIRKLIEEQREETTTDSSDSSRTPFWRRKTKTIDEKDISSRV